MNFPDDSLGTLVRRDDQIAVGLGEDGPCRNRRLEMPVRCSRVEAYDLALRIYSVDVGAVRRSQRSEFRSRCLADVCFAEIDAARKSLGVHECDGALLGIETKHSFD